MRCTDCNLYKETIPEQLRYVYCTKHRVEVSVAREFDKCPLDVTATCIGEADSSLKEGTVICASFNAG